MTSNRCFDRLAIDLGQQELCFLHFRLVDCPDKCVGRFDIRATLFSPSSFIAGKPGPVGRPCNEVGNRITGIEGAITHCFCFSFVIQARRASEWIRIPVNPLACASNLYEFPESKWILELILDSDCILTDLSFSMDPLA